MNEMTAQSKVPRGTRAAEGLVRWRWTTAELIRLTELGVFRAEDKFELIGGEIVPMSPTGRKHEVVAEDLADLMTRRAPERVRIGGERQFNLDVDTYTKPDIVVRPAGTKTYDLSGDKVLLVIEVAASSKSYDTGTKAAVYARFGVREYWVVDAATLETTVHLAPGDNGYASVAVVQVAELLTPSLVPELAVRLSELDLD